MKPGRRENSENHAASSATIGLLPQLLHETIEESRFRAGVRSWLSQQSELVGTSKRASSFAREVDEAEVAQVRSFQSRLHDAGFAGISWPKEYGGQGKSKRYEMIFGDEVSVYELPTKPLTVGLGMCGPTILAHGTNEQKTRYLRPLLRAEEIWSQLFSEPEAGSDLASVRSFAKRNGADWRLNGQKVWISGAQYADFGLLLCRTDQSSVPHSGLSMFILNMRAPGVLVRPLRQMTGHAKFSEVFFDDVAIPDSNRVGQVGEGWRCLITTLMAERLTISQARDAARCGSSTQLIEIARAREVAEDPRVRDMIVTVWTQERTLQLLRDRKNAALRSDREPGPEGSLAKMGFSKLVTDASNGGVGLTGPGALAWSPDDSFGEDWAERLCLAQGLKIGGGTLEIQKNTIGERVLGLPKEP